MKDEAKTREQLIKELKKAKEQIARFKKLELAQKKLEDALRKSEERFRNIAENAEEWVWEVDVQGKYTYSSPVVKKILGYKPEEIVGEKYFYDLFPLEEREELKKAAFEVFDKKISFREFINLNVHKKGTKVWLSTSGVPILDKKGNLLGYRGADTDITERKRVEETLKQAQAQSRDLVEKAGIAIFIDDVEGNIVFYNKKFLNIWGYSEEEIEKTLNLSLVYPDDVEIVKKYHNARVQGKDAPTRYEFRGIRKDRSMVFLEINVTPIKENDKIIGTRSYIWDITERKKSEKTASALHEISKAINESSNIDMLYPQIHKIIGKVIDATNFYIALYDNQHDIIRFTYFTDEQDDEPEIRIASKSGSLTAEVINTGKTLLLTQKQLKEKYRKPKKEWGAQPKIWLGVPLKFKNEIIGAIAVQSYTNPNLFTEHDVEILESVSEAIAFDIQRKKTEEALWESEKKYRQVVEQASDLIFTTDMNGNWQFSNDALRQLSGYSMEEVRNMNYLDFIVPEYKKRVQFHYIKQFLKKQPSSYLEFPWMSKSGKIIWLASNVNLVVENDEVVGFHAVSRDISGQKKAEAALRKSEERFRLAANVSTDLIYEWDIKTNELLWFGGIDEALGYQPDEIPRTIEGWINLIHPEDLDRLDDSVENHRTSKELIHEEYRVRHNDGSWRYWIDKGTPVLGPKQLPLKWIGSCVDITDAKKAERALQESERNYRNLIEASNDGIYLLYEHKFEIVNKKFLEMLHITKKDLNKPDFDFMDLVAPQSRPLIEERTQKSIKGEKLESTYEFTGLTKDGKEIEIETSVSYVKYKESIATLGIFRNITERKRAKEALQQSEEKYKSLTDQLPVGVYRTTEKGKILHVNLALVNILGYENVEEFMKTSSVEVYDDPGVRNKQLEQWKESRGILSNEIKFRTKKGTKIIVHDTGKVILNKNGEIDYIDGIVEDITERKRAEEKLKRSLKEKEVLLQEIHHRVKNNLMVIIGLFHFYTSDLKNKKVKSLLSNIENTIHSIVLIHELLYKSSNLELINFKYYVMELISYLQVMHHMDSSLFNVEIDIGKVFLNLKTAIPCGMIINELISNILKHAFPPALIDRRSKSIKNREKPCHILVHLSAKGKVKSGRTSKPLEYTMVIRDNGVGFPEDYDIRKSRSLGLTLVNLMVKQLDGEVEFENKNGTVFTIHFKEQ